MIIKHVHGLNLYTNKIPILYDYIGNTTKNGKMTIWKRCVVCEHMKSPRQFGKLVRNICKLCVKEISEGGSDE